MRVIAGEARGRRLVAPRGLTVRPTADRVRQSIFDMLAFRWAGGRVLDLFAGTGAMGIEALSRGAAEAVFVERDRMALAALEENLRRCGYENRARIVRGDFRRALHSLAASGVRVGLAFIDPPYEAGLIDEAMVGIAPLLTPGAWVVVETATTEPPPVLPTGWHVEAERSFGRTKVYLYRYE